MPLLPLLTLLLALRAPQDSPLPPGDHPVGFDSSWILDAGRTYRYPAGSGATYGGAAGAPRPILVNTWYPAADPEDGVPMVHGDYFEIAPEDLDLIPLANALADHALEVVRGEVGDKLDRVLEEQAGARRGAAPAEGPFPVVLYHSGAGSSYEDNARFCAFLASHGFVVLSSAYPRADGTSLNIDGGNGSGDDFEALTRHAHGLVHADTTRLGLAGHSAGAQAVLRHSTWPSSRVDATVLLDTTADYYGPSLPLHTKLIEDVDRRRASLEVPLFVAAGSEATFQLCDSMTGSRRLYWTVPELGHNEYIDQGLQTLAGDEGPAAEAVRETHGELGRHVLAFFQAELMGERGALARIEVSSAANPLGGPRPHVEVAEPGIAGPQAYDPESSLPPTPRQIPGLMRDHGPEVTGEVLLRFAEVETPWRESSMVLGSLLWELVEEGRVEEARELLACIETFQPRVTGVFTFLADFGELAGRSEQVRRSLLVHSALDPDNEALRERLLELDRPRTER